MGDSAGTGGRNVDGFACRTMLAMPDLRAVHTCCWHDHVRTSVDEWPPWAAFASGTVQRLLTAADIDDVDYGIWTALCHAARLDVGRDGSVGRDAAASHVQESMRADKHDAIIVSTCC